MFQDLLPGSEVAHSNPVVAAAAAAVAAAVSSASEITVPIVSHTTVSLKYFCYVSHDMFFSHVLYTHCNQKCRYRSFFIKILNPFFIWVILCYFHETQKRASK